MFLSKFIQNFSQQIDFNSRSRSALPSRQQNSQEVSSTNPVNPFFNRRSSGKVGSTSPIYPLFDKMIQIKDVEGMANIISKLPNPDIILRKTGKGMDTLRNLTNHYQVGTCIDSRKSGVLSKLFDLQQDKTPDKNFEFFKEVFSDIDIYGLMENILDAPLYGYAPIEITWEKQGKYIIPAKFEAEPQEWFHFNSNGDFFFKHKNYTPNGLLINPDESRKFLLPKNKPTRKNPYGQCILSRCFWNVAFINGGMEFWVKMTEKYGMPFMVGKYDRSMNKEEKESLLRALVNMVQDAVGVIPADGTVEIMDAGGKGASAEIYEKLVTKCENNISKAILGQTLTTDIGKNGSFAAAQTHNEVRNDIINSDRRLCEKTINTLIKYINEINFSESQYPKCTIFDEQDIDQSLAERDNKIYNTGVRFTKTYMMKTYGYAEDDIVMIGVNETCSQNENTTPPVEKGVNEGVNGSGEFNDKTAQPVINDFSEKNSNELQDPIDMFSIFTPEDLQNLITPALKPIIEFFTKFRNAEECMEKLAEVYPQMDTEELEKTLTKVIFISELLGRG